MNRKGEAKKAIEINTEHGLQQCSKRGGKRKRRNITRRQYRGWIKLTMRRTATMVNRIFISI